MASETWSSRGGAESHEEARMTRSIGTLLLLGASGDLSGRLLLPALGQLLDREESRRGTNRVTVNGAPAQFVQKGFSDVYVKPGNPIPAGGTFQVVVVYAGKPADYKQSDAHPWWSSDGEWTAAGEPESSAWWYPANDQPGGAQPAPSQQAVQRPHRAAYVVLVGAGSEDWEANGRQNEFGRHSTMGKSPRRRCRVCWTQPAIRRPTSRAQRICGH
jgi:hypothetical protein